MADIINQGSVPLTPAEMQMQMASLDRQRKIADALQQQSFQAPEGQIVGNHYMVPSWTQYLSKIAQGLVGKNQQSDLDAKQLAIATQQGDMMRRQYGIGTQGPSAVAAPQDQVSAPSMGLGSGMTGTDDASQASRMGTQQLAQVAQALTKGQMTQPAAPQQAPTQQTPAGSRLIPGMDPYTAFSMGNDPKTEAAYAAAFLKQYEPTEFSRDLKLVPKELQAAAVSQKFLPPVIARGSPVLTRGADGKLQVDPASVEAMRTQEDVKGAYEAPITLKTTTGQEVQISRPEWAEYQKTGNLPVRFLSPEARAAAQQDTDSKGTPSTVNVNTPFGPVSGQITPKNIGQIGVSQTPFNQQMDKDEAGRVSKMKEEIYDKGTSAIDKVAQNNKMIELLPTVTTGPLNKQINMVKNIGNSLGLDIGDPSPNQEFEKYAIQGALSAAKQIYGGRITNQDVTTQIASNPGATMTEKAIYQMLKYDNEIQQRHIQKMTAFGEYGRNGGDPREFQVYFAQKYPFQGVVAPENGKSQSYKVETPQLAQPKKETRPSLDSIIKVR